MELNSFVLVQVELMLDSRKGGRKDRRMSMGTGWVAPGSLEGLWEVVSGSIQRSWGAGTISSRWNER